MKKAVPFLTILLFCSSFAGIKKNLIRWEFDNFKKLTFTYEQIMDVYKDHTFDTDKTKTFIKAQGLLIVTVINSESADIAIKEIKMTQYRVDSLGDTSVLVNMNAPDMFIKDLKEDGTIGGEIEDKIQTLARTIFPIANKEMAIGDSVDIPLTVPFGMYTTLINAKGYNRVKYVNDKGDIAEIATVINVSDYIVPKGVETKYICYMKGDSNYEFNTQKGFFAGGIININMVTGYEEKDSIKHIEIDMKTTIKIEPVSVE